MMICCMLYVIDQSCIHYSYNHDGNDNELFRMYVCIQLDGWVDECMYVCMYACMDTCMVVCMHVCMVECMHVFIHYMCCVML